MNESCDNIMCRYGQNIVRFFAFSRDAVDYARNGKIDLYHGKIKRLKKGCVYRLVMKLTGKLESSLEAQRRARDHRAL
ncbi:MAG: hypothetical protein NWE77_03335 [Candidatus Bathyarchaeota archaeon]|nr:hypothetical protein [Candidatus Bathyarchaeota archaeon]